MCSQYGPGHRFPPPLGRALAAAALLAAPLAGCADVSPDASSAPTTENEPLAEARPLPLPDSTVRRLTAEDPLWADALRLHAAATVVDFHVDTPMHLVDAGYALGRRHAPRPDGAQLDGPRLREGGLDVPVFSVYVARSFGEDSAAVDRARTLLAEARRQVAALPTAASAWTADEVERITGAGRTAVLYSLEGGHALARSPAILRELAAAGIRSVGLTHANTNAWADSATDAARHGGLTDEGRALVAEMNRLGVLVDLSHASDATFFDALAASTAPPILSHSACRAVYDHPRNASDAMLRALAAAGGVVFVNAYADHLGGTADLDAFLDHVEHALRVAGPDHVGLGSDFDGVPRATPGLEDVTRLPHVTYGLLRRGHAPATVRKVLGENALRVLRDAERLSARR